MQLTIEPGMTASELSAQAAELFNATITTRLGGVELPAEVSLDSVEGNKIGRGKSVLIMSSTTSGDVRDYIDKWIGLDVEICSPDAGPVPEDARLLDLAKKADPQPISDKTEQLEPAPEAPPVEPEPALAAPPVEPEPAPEVSSVESAPSSDAGTSAGHFSIRAFDRAKERMPQVFDYTGEDGAKGRSGKRGEDGRPGTTEAGGFFSRDGGNGTRGMNAGRGGTAGMRGGDAGSGQNVVAELRLGPKDELLLKINGEFAPRLEEDEHYVIDTSGGAGGRGGMGGRGGHGGDGGRGEDGSRGAGGSGGSSGGRGGDGGNGGNGGHGSNGGAGGHGGDGGNAGTISLYCFDPRLLGLVDLRADAGRGGRGGKGGPGGHGGDGGRGGYGGRGGSGSASADGKRHGLSGFSGASGRDGIPGRSGQPGRDGENGRDSNAAPAEYVVSYPDGHEERSTENANPVLRIRMMEAGELTDGIFTPGERLRIGVDIRNQGGLTIPEGGKLRIHIPILEPDLQTWTLPQLGPGKAVSYEFEGNLKRDIEHGTKARAMATFGFPKQCPRWGLKDHEFSALYPVYLKHFRKKEYVHRGEETVYSCDLRNYSDVEYGDNNDLPVCVRAELTSGPASIMHRGSPARKKHHQIHAIAPKNDRQQDFMIRIKDDVEFERERDVVVRTTLNLQDNIIFEREERLIVVRCRKIIAMYWCIFGGLFGFHRIYTEHHALGFGQLLISATVLGAMIAVDFQGRYFNLLVILAAGLVMYTAIDLYRICTGAFRDHHKDPLA